MQDQTIIPYQGKTNTLAIISLISGILSIFSLPIYFCMPCCTFFGLTFSALGIILGAFSMKTIRESNGTENGMQLATGGLITGLVSIVLVIAYYFIIFAIGLIVYPFTN